MFGTLLRRRRLALQLKLFGPRRRTYRSVLVFTILRYHSFLAFRNLKALML
jgi:hypothetical protein